MALDIRQFRTSFGSVDALVGGDGPTLLLLHRDNGRPGWGALQERLARSFRVVMPSLPGFDASERIEWLRNVPDLAAVFGEFLDRIDDGPIDIVGLGFGGWLAAEIAARDPSRVSSLFLHAPMGVKPPEGEIADFVLWETMAFLRYGFENGDAYDRLVAEAPEGQRDNWENNREIVMRIAWKPYMYDPALPHLLRATPTPAAIAWSRGDLIVPRSAAVAYADALPNGRLIELPEGGHHADIETPDLLADAILSFLDADAPALAAAVPAE